MDNKQCSYCLYYAYDVEMDEYYCSMNMDQDDLEKNLYAHRRGCTGFRMGDDYTIVKKQL